jgi:hypothetical protein
MNIKNLKKLLQQGEGLKVEFKTSRFKLSKNVFETLCAFLNRKGGHLILGVKDDGTIEGVLEDSIQSITDRGLCRTLTLFSTSFVVAPHCTAGMPFAIGIPLGGTLKLTSYCPKDSYGERSLPKGSLWEKWASVMQRPLIIL